MRYYKLGMIVGGILLAVWGVREGIMAGGAKAEPQTITCADLGRDGPGNNAHVVLTDFIISPGTFVYQEGKRGGAWSKVWVPLLPVGGAWDRKVQALLEQSGTDDPGDVLLPQPETFSVLVRSSLVPNERGLSILEMGGELRGLVINEIDSLGREEEKLLAGEYPNVNLDECWIIDHARTPKSMGTVILLVGAGVVLAGLGVWLVLPRRRRVRDYSRGRRPR